MPPLAYNASLFSAFSVLFSFLMRGFVLFIFFLSVDALLYRFSVIGDTQKVRDLLASIHAWFRFGLLSIRTRICRYDDDVL